MRIPEFDPQQVRRRLDAADPTLHLLDVREPEEVAIAAIEGARHVPMGTVPHALEDLDRNVEWTVYCHHGQRSALVCSFLLSRGYLKVANLRGGIDAWSRDVDPEMPRY